MTAIRDLPNIGPQSAAWLESVGVSTEDDLHEMGAVEAYKRVKAAYPERVSLNLLWGLQGALLELPWNELPPDMKAKLKAQIEE